MAKIMIVGSGFVGQANGRVLVDQGHDVVFVDIDPGKIQTLSNLGYKAISTEEMPGQTADIVFVSVPTPTEADGVNVQYVCDAMQMVAEHVVSCRSEYVVIVLKSTVPPGTTRDVVLPILEKYSKKKVGQDFGLVFEPEYLRERTAYQDALSPRTVLLGVYDARSAGCLVSIRSVFHCLVECVSIEDAEMQKYIHNIFNATKITFFNEMREICRKMKVDSEKIFDITTRTAEAFWNPHYGVRDFGPFDGACLPKDTAGFLAFAKKKLQTDMPLLSAVIHVNKNLPNTKNIQS